VSALDLNVEKDRSLVSERGGLVDRWGGGAIFGAAESFERGAVEVEADDVVDAFVEVEVAVEGGVFREGDELGRGDLSGGSENRVSSDYA
jgi:hypothetical protein